MVHYSAIHSTTYLPWKLPWNIKVLWNYKTSNLTSMLQFISLSFIYIMHWDHFLCPACVYEPPPAPSLSSVIDSRRWHPFLHAYAHTLPVRHGFNCSFVGGPPLPALTQWCFLCNRVLISVWINAFLVWHADKVPLQVVPMEQRARIMSWGKRDNVTWL